MKKIVLIVACAAWLAGSMGSDAADAGASVDVASAYVFRGVTFNDGLAIQPGLEASSDAFTFGVWGNLDASDYDGLVVDGQFSEIDLYGSYALPVEEVDLSIGYTEYTYPGAEGDADREVSVSAGLDLPLAPSVGLFYGLDGGIEKTLYVELGLGHTVELTGSVAVDLGATLGYVSPDEGDSGFSHYTVSAGTGIGPLGIGVTYVGQIDDDVLPDFAPATEEGDASFGYDTEVIGTLSLAWDL